MKEMCVLSYYQQLSRCRKCKDIKMFLLNTNNNTNNNYISYKKNKEKIDKEIHDYINYMKRQNPKVKYMITDEIEKLDKFREINYYMNWYRKLFTKNKLEILKIILDSVGYIIEENIIENEILNEENNKEIKEEINKKKEKE